MARFCFFIIIVIISVFASARAMPTPQPAQVLGRDPIQEINEYATKAIGGIAQVVLTLAEPAIRVLEDVTESDIMNDPVETAIDLENLIRRSDPSIDEISPYEPLSKDKRVIQEATKPVANLFEKFLDFFF